MPSAIVHFEIHVRDVERARKFYGDVFDWKIEEFPGTEYYGVWTSRSKYPSGSVVGMDRGLRLRQDYGDNNAPVNAFLCTVETDDIDQTLERIKKSDGVILQPKSAFPGVGWQALCADQDGNRFGLMENDPNVR